MSSTAATVVRGGRLLDLRAHRAEPADILILGDTIEMVGPPGLPAPDGAVVVDATGRLMHPGLVNAHTHGHGNLAKGMGDRWTLELLLAAGPWISGNRSIEDQYLSTQIGAAEMLLKGCTACYDLPAAIPGPTMEGIEAAARAYADIGMRAVIAPMLADRSFYEAVPGLMAALSDDQRSRVARLALPPFTSALEVMRRSAARWPFARERVRLAIAPTIPHHCSDAFLTACRDLARELDLPLHSHVQESKVQVIAGLKLYGRTPTAHLDALGLLGPDFTVAHGVWLDDDDMRRLGDRGASVAHNPGSNMRLGNGLADVRRMLDRRINVGIGTDGANCCDHQSMYESLRAASYVSKSQCPDTDRWLSTDEILEAATVGSARALGFGSDIGRIAAGYKADIVLLDLAHVNWMPLNDPTNQIVHTEDGSAVHSVMVGGRMVVRNRQIVGVDMPALAARAEAARARLAESNRPNRGLFDALAATVNTFCPALAHQAYHVDRFGGRPTVGPV